MTKRQFFVCATFCFAMFFLTGCAEFDRKFDIALYGSEEEAKKANEQYELKRGDRENENQRELEDKVCELIHDVYHVIPAHGLRRT